MPNFYQYDIQVEAVDIDEQNHVNNAVYLRYIQDIAQAHWKNTATEALKSQIGWVARRHEIDYLKQAHIGDTLTLKTWIESHTGVTTIRRCEIYKGSELITKSITVWVAVNPLTFRPQRIPVELSALF
jgi:acyl-CoA thioester hydrolase